MCRLLFIGFAHEGCSSAVVGSVAGLRPRRGVPRGDCGWRKAGTIAATERKLSANKSIRVGARLCGRRIRSRATLRRQAQRCRRAVALPECRCLATQEQFVAKRKRPTLTTMTGTPVSDNLNIQTAGRRGPALLQDIWLIEKMAHVH